MKPLGAIPVAKAAGLGCFVCWNSIRKFFHPPGREGECRRRLRRERTFRFAIFAVLALLASHASLLAANRYVAQNGQTPVSPYATWETAALHIQDAVAASAAGDTIWLGPGTYIAPSTPVNYQGTNVVLIDKVLALKGASGNPADTIIDGGGAHRGVGIKFIGNSAHQFVLEGVTVRNGSATRGGGVYIDTGNWTWNSEIRNCIIRDNVSSGDGGGIATRENYGAASTLLIEDCLIADNQASPVAGKGGGVFAYLNGGGLTVTDSVVRGNQAFMGGGLRISGGSNRIENCRITENRAVELGGGISSTGADTYRNSLFDKNLCDSSGRGKGGGGVALTSDSKTIEITNCTFAENAPSGIMIQTKSATLAVANTILHSNGTANVMEYPSTLYPSTVTFDTVCATPLIPGTGNFAADPEFDGTDYYLKPASPCIGAGAAAGWMSGAVDLDGNDRINGTVDLGCYEFRAPPLLAENGVANAEIVIAPNPPRMVTWAANELQEYLFKITGATVPIVSTQTPGALHLYVGRSLATDLLKLSNEGLTSGAFVIETGRDWIAFLGQDDDFVSPLPSHENWSLTVAANELADWDTYTGKTWQHPLGPLHRDYNKANDVWAHDKRGSLNAVHEYLRGLGVRWFLPGALGEVVPQMASLELPRIHRTVHPDFPVRCVQFSLNRFFMATLDELKWQMRMGLNNGEEWRGLTAPGHGIALVTSRPETKAAHPEYYAVWDNVIQDAPCLSSSGLMAENVALGNATFDRYGVRMLNVMPTDGFGRMCEHPGCVGLDTPLRGHNGKFSDYVWNYVNQVAQQLYLTHPDKRIDCGAYTTYLLPPANIATLSPNVTVTLCRWRTWTLDPATKTFYQDVTNEWLSKLPSGELYVWDYYLHTRGNGQWAGVPVYFPRLISEDLKFLKGKSKGEFVEFDRNDSSVDGWDVLAINHLNLYVTSRLWWDADQDVEALLDDYYAKFYGPAAAQMKAFVDYCEANWQVMRTPEGTAQVDQSMVLLAAAADAADNGGGTVYSDRVQLTVAYTERLVAYRDLFRDRYVAQNGQTPVPPYLTWATAAANIQDAVSSAVEGNTIWVGPGTYTAPATPLTHEGTNVVLADKLVTLRGSTGNPQDTIIDGGGLHRGIAVKYIGNNAHRFILDGFTVRNGSSNRGGGIYLDTGNWSWNAEIRNCIIRDNTSSGDGGGLATRPNYTATSTLLIENCLIADNQASLASGLGGGVLAQLGGGGLTLINSLVEGNAAFTGGGLRITTGSNRIENSRITGNYAANLGGGIHTTGADIYRNVLFDNNFCDDSGRSKGGGGLALTSQSKTPEITNCTVAENEPSGIMIQMQGSTLPVTNTIIHSNIGPDVIEYPSSLNPSTITYTHVCTTTAKPGTGNLTLDPQFGGPDFTLQATSPCIDAGVDAPWMTGAMDLGGNDRLNGTVDIGCHEAL